MPSVLPSHAAGCGVQIRGIRRSFDTGVVALDGITLHVAPGEFLAILGPSGCGKSTLLRLIAGLDQPQAGMVEIDSTPTLSPTSPFSYRDAPHAGIAYVFQDAHLLPWRNVLENVALPLELMQVNRRNRLPKAQQAIEGVGIADLMSRYPNQLSGGQRMRVSLARAMVTDPTLLLLDEPFAALDEITRQRLDEQLREIWITRRMTVVFVTHSTQEAVFLAQRALVMCQRPGRIIADHRVDLPMDRPGSTRATPDFAREMRVLYEALERGGT